MLARCLGGEKNTQESSALKENPNLNFERTGNCQGRVDDTDT